MTAVDTHISLTITQDSVAVSRRGFGVAMMLSHKATFPERQRRYGSLAELAADALSGGSVATSPEYLCAQAYFSQSPRPKEIVVGKALNVPTQQYVVTVATLIDNWKYKLNVKGEGVTATAVEFESDATATDNEVTAGLKTALDLVTGRNYDVTDNMDGTLTIAGQSAGDWFSIESPEVANLSIIQNHADPGVAADLTAIKAEGDDWYCLLTLYNSNAFVEAARAWVEANTKIYAADSSDSLCITGALGAGDTIDDIKTANAKRTVGWYHPSPADMLAASIVGRVLPRDPGTVTWKWKNLSGPAPLTNLTSTQRTNLRNKKGNTYEVIAGRGTTWEGWRGDGSFIDVTRAIDDLTEEVKKSCVDAFNDNDAIPFEDDGVELVKGEIRGALLRKVEQGSLARDPEPTVTAPKVADVPPADKDNRNLPDIKFNATLSGAIHTLAINGVVSL